MKVRFVSSERAVPAGCKGPGVCNEVAHSETAARIQRTICYETRIVVSLRLGISNPVLFNHQTEASERLIQKEQAKSLYRR